MSKEKIVIFILIILLFWFGATIVRLENYHYASQIGLCENEINPTKNIERDKCLNITKTRTNWIYNLIYGLKIF